MRLHFKQWSVVGGQWPVNPSNHANHESIRLSSFSVAWQIANGSHPSQKPNEHTPKNDPTTTNAVVFQVTDPRAANGTATMNPSANVRPLSITRQVVPNSSLRRNQANFPQMR